MQEYQEDDTAVNWGGAARGVVLGAQQFSGLGRAPGAESATEPERPL